MGIIFSNPAVLFVSYDAQDALTSENVRGFVVMEGIKLPKTGAEIFEICAIIERNRKLKQVVPITWKAL